MKSWTHSISRMVLSLVMLLTMLGTAASPTVSMEGAGTPIHPVRGPEPPASPQDVPAPPTGGPRPTVTLNPTHGYAGQSVTVSGQGVTPYPGVRVAWLTGDATLTAAVVNLQPSNAYSATLTVPADAKPGPAKVCTTVTGAEMAEFACAAFMIDAPPPGSVRGLIPMSTAALGTEQMQTINAAFVMLDQSGSEVVSATIAADGSYTVSQVAPGHYVGLVRGEVSRVFGPTQIDVLPGLEASVGPASFEPVSSTVSYYCMAHPDTVAGSVTAMPNGLPYDTRHFGIYLSLGPSGSAVNVTFEAGNIQANLGSQIQGVVFRLETESGNPVVITDTVSPYQMTYNVSQLAPGTYTLVAATFGTDCPGAAVRYIDVIANPLAQSSIVRELQIGFSYEMGNDHYWFHGWMPNVGGLLPVIYPNPPPTILGVELENRLDAGVYFAGELKLNGDMRMVMMQAKALARLFGIDIFDESVDILPPGADQIIWNLAESGNSYHNFEFSSDLFEWEIPIFEYMWGIPDLANISLRISVGVGGAVYIRGTLWPLQPNLSMHLGAGVLAYIDLAFEAEILFGLLSGNVALRSSIGVHLPLRIRTYETPPIFVNAPCVYLRLQVLAEGCIFWGLYCEEYSETLADWESEEECAPPAQMATQAVAGSPRVMASPSIASGPGGRMLSAYIDDATPDVITPTSKVMARFWITQTSTWGSASPLTDGSHAVHDPAAAFVGPNGGALVAWTENIMTPEEYLTGGGNFSTALARQEIYYAYWDGAAWGDPQRLTNDTAPMPDGSTSLAGDALGATLAWVRDTDGNNVTRTDWQIAVTQWITTTHTWGAFELLDASPVMTLSTTLSANTSPALAASPVLSTTQFHVDSTLDEPDAYPGDGQCNTYSSPMFHRCTLRAAIQEANALPGPEAIIVPESVYTLTLAGRGEDNAATGDLDIPQGQLIISGAGPDKTVINGNQIDTVFQVMASAAVTMTHLTIRNGSGLGLPSNPGGLNNAGTGMLRDCVLADNTAQGNGGAVVNKGALTLDSTRVTTNTAGWNGGGIYNESGVLTLSDSTVGNNQAQTYSGGGIANAQGTLIMRNSTVARNTAQSDGGGVWLASSATITNSTISRNKANASGGGMSVNGGVTYLNNVTIARNGSSTGGGVSKTSTSTFNLANTLIGTNAATSTPDCSGTLVSQGNNLIQSTAGCGITGTTTGNITGRDPRLLDLGDFGGSTQLHALSYDSPAINAGNPITPGSGGYACEATDQRGVARPQAALCDIGAYERKGGTGVMNAQVNVARQVGYNGQSRVFLTWTADADGDLTTGDDRRIIIAEKKTSGWSLSTPQELPAGADSPSLALKVPPEMQLAFLVRSQNGGIGNQAVVWNAAYTYLSSPPYGWTAAPLLDEQNLPVRGERPLLASDRDQGETLLVFRRFGNAGTNGYLGQLAMSRQNYSGAFSPPVYLTDEARQNWQPAVAINPATRQAVVLHVSRPSQGKLTDTDSQHLLAPASTAARSVLESTLLSVSGDPVESLTVAPGADPTLDPKLALSRQHASPGATVIVSATLRNLGRDGTYKPTLNLYAGSPVSGTLLITTTFPDSLGFNQSAVVTFSVTSGAGLQPYSVQVTTAGSNLSTANDVATGNLGELSAPTMVQVVSSTLYTNALQVAWSPPSVEGIDGYRILRSESAGGPYELVGEATGAIFNDVMLKRDQRYYYVVQTYDASGVRSAYSAEANGLLPLFRLYLPVILR